MWKKSYRQKGIKGITVEINGNTSPLDKALKNVNSTAKELQSELTAVEKALKLDPNNITLTAQKSQILKEEIAAVKEKLDALKASQTQVKTQFAAGTINAEQFRAFQRELETTKAKLSGLKDEAKSVSVIGTAFASVKEKVQAVLDKLAPVANGIKKVGEVSADLAVGGVKVVGTAVNGAAQALKAYTAGAAAAGTAVTAMTVKAATAADEINTLSKQTGLSTSEIQKFQFASEIIDVPMETLTGSMAKLTRNMASATDPTKGVGKAFSELGVSVRDSQGNLKSNQTVFNESILALGKIENATERDALAMQIFGKSAQDLNPLILGGADALKQLGDDADRAGLIMSQDALDNLNGFRDSLDVMKSSTGAASNVLSGVFAGGMKSAVDTINQMIPQVTGSLAQLFSGENMAGAQAQLTDDLISGFTQMISDFAEQLPQFLDGFNAVITALVTAIIAVLPQVINTILPTMIQGLVDLVNSLLPQIPILLPILINAGLQLFMGLINGLNQVIPQLMAMLPVIIQQLGDTIIANLPLIISAGIQLLVSLIQGLAQTIPQLIPIAIDAAFTIMDTLLDNLDLLIDAGIELILAVAFGLIDALPKLVEKIPVIIEKLVLAIMNNLPKILDGEYIIDSQQAEIVKWIFDSYSAGMLPKFISQSLNERCIPTFWNAQWNRIILRNIIRNSFYTGQVVLQRYFVEDYLTKKLRQNTGELPRYIVSDHHPAIIPKDLYDRVQIVFDSRRPKTRSKTTITLFSGIITCGNCGKHFTRKTINGVKKWLCQTYEEQGKDACPAKLIPEKTLIEVTTEALGLTEFDEQDFQEKISQIVVPRANELDFYLAKGTIIHRTWKDRSRRESWTPEMREQARLRSIEKARQKQ